MKFSILRAALLRLLRIASGVVERRQQHSVILANVLLRIKESSLEIVATDQEVEVVAAESITNVDSIGETTVPFRKLHEICKALPDSAEITLATNDDKVVITSGRSRFTLATLPASQFPDVQSISNDTAACAFIIPKKQFRWLVARTAFAMADQDVRYFLNGMLLELKGNRLYSVAADGHRLAMNYVDLHQQQDTQPVRVIIPRKGILEIMRMLDEGDTELCITIVANHIRVQSDGITVTSKLLDGKFPDYERVIPRGGDKVVVGNREQLKEAFHRAAAVFSEKFRGVRLKMSPASLMVLASNPEQDEVEEYLEVDYAGQELEVGFNVRYLIDFLTVAQSDLVRFTMSDANKSTLIEEVGEDARGAYVLMPIRT